MASQMTFVCVGHWDKDHVIRVVQSLCYEMFSNAAVDWVFQIEQHTSTKWWNIFIDGPIEDTLVQCLRESFRRRL